VGFGHGGRGHRTRCSMLHATLVSHLSPLHNCPYLRRPSSAVFFMTKMACPRELGRVEQCIGRERRTYQPSSPAASTQPSSSSSYPSAPSTDPPAPAAACPPIASRYSPVSGWRWRALVVAGPQARIVRLLLWEQRRRAGGWFGASWVEWRRVSWKRQRRGQLMGCGSN
jgi:hypothetical protein